MRLTFSTTGKTFHPGDSRVPESECFAALHIEHARRVLTESPWTDSTQVYVDLNTEQAQALLDQLLRDYPYLRGRVEQDPSSGRWYVLDEHGERKYGPYLEEHEARSAAR